MDIPTTLFIVYLFAGCIFIPYIMWSSFKQKREINLPERICLGLFAGHTFVCVLLLVMYIGVAGISINRK